MLCGWRSSGIVQYREFADPLCPLNYRESKCGVYVAHRQLFRIQQTSTERDGQESIGFRVLDVRVVGFSMYLE